MSEQKLKQLTQKLKELHDEYVIKKSEKGKLEKILKVDYKITSIDEALKRIEGIKEESAKLKKKRDTYIEKAEVLLNEYEGGLIDEIN